MTQTELYSTLKKEFLSLLQKKDLNQENIMITTKSLTAEEAIGITTRKDYPILTGKEILLQAKYHSSFGQAFTDSPTDYQGTLEEIANLDIIHDSHARSIFIAALNAVKNELHFTENVIHCKNEGPELCAHHILSYLKNNYENPHILLVGFQPAMMEILANHFSLRVLDLNPINIGSVKNGIAIEHGITDKDAAIEWSDLILCTGSTICNGSIIHYLDLNKDILFFGTTISGSADILNIKRLCYADLTVEEQNL